LTASGDIDDILLRGSLTAIRAAYAARRLSVSEAVDWYLARIAAQRQLNAVRELSSRAREDAAAADRDISAGHDKGPLHGIPILLKDNILTACGMTATAGAAALSGFRPKREAALASRLRAAGAIILGKTNMTEFADFVSDVMPAEFSGGGGVVRNPHGPAYGRGLGSSVGSAAAVAAGLCPVAIGSETQNSIQGRVLHSSVVGLKPSVGLVSRTGLVPLVPSQDSPGPIARSVRDAATVLSVIAGADMSDTASLAISRPVDASNARREISGLRIGVPRRAMADRKEFATVLPSFSRVLSQLSSAGAIIIDPCDLPSAEQLLEVRSCVFRTEFKASLDAFLETTGAPCGISSLAALIRWNAQHPETIPYGQSLLLAANETQGLDDPTYRFDRARDIALSRDAGIDAGCTIGAVDVLIAPMGAAAKCTGKAGAPVVAIPCGRDSGGAPFGVTLFSPWASDWRLVANAEAIERIVGERCFPAIGEPHSSG